MGVSGYLGALFTWFFAALWRDPDVTAVVASPMEMTLTAPPESTHKDVADQSALVALGVGHGFGVGVGGTPFRHKTDEDSES